MDKDKVCISIPEYRLYSMSDGKLVQALDTWIEMYAKYYDTIWAWRLDFETMEYIGCFSGRTYMAGLSYKKLKEIIKWRCDET